MAGLCPGSARPMCCPGGRAAAEALRDIGMEDKVQRIVSGGIRSEADVAKALALGASPCRSALLVGLGCNKPTHRFGGKDHDTTADYAATGTAPGYCHHCHTGLCAVGLPWYRWQTRTGYLDNGRAGYVRPIWGLVGMRAKVPCARCLKPSWWSEEIGSEEAGDV